MSYRWPLNEVFNDPLQYILFKKISLKLLSEKFPLKQHVPILRWVDPIDSIDLDNGLGTVLTAYALSFQPLFPGFDACLGML